jgi:hypothetical protein
MPWSMPAQYVFRPVLLTAVAVVVGASVILFDPIFQGLVISLMAGEVASTLLSRLAVPVLYYMVEKHKRLAPGSNSCSCALSRGIRMTIEGGFATDGGSVRSALAGSRASSAEPATGKEGKKVYTYLPPRQTVSSARKSSELRRDGSWIPAGRAMEARFPNYVRS